MSSNSLIINLVWILICSRTSHGSDAMTGRVYQQMTYNATSSSLAQLALQNKFVCAAQCAHQYASCNTAVYDASVSPQCVLYSEPVMPAQLVRTASARVYDFQQLKFRATTSTTSTSTTSTSTTSTSTTSTSTTSTTTTSTTTTTTTTSTTTTTTTTKTTTTTSTASTMGSLSLSGVQINLDPASLPSGWSLCYSISYGAGLGPSNMASILSTCNGAKLLIGCRISGNSVLAVAAMGNRDDVLYNCGSSISCTHVANGVGWYYEISHSWGFVQGTDPVSRNTCDGLAAPNDGYRMCWHTSDNIGHRCGGNTGLAGGWDRVIYHAN